MNVSESNKYPTSLRDLRLRNCERCIRQEGWKILGLSTGYLGENMLSCNVNFGTLARIRSGRRAIKEVLKVKWPLPITSWICSGRKSEDEGDEKTTPRKC